MKTIILFIFLSLQVFAQSDLLHLFDDSGFDPLTYDNKTLLLFDGDKGLTTTSWEDQVGSNDITLYGAVTQPTIVTNAINGHTAVLINGFNQSGFTQNPTINQPSTTYIVFKQVTWTGNYYVFDGYAQNTRILIQLTSTPNLAINAGASLNSNPDLAVNTYGIFTCVYNGANSQIRTNTSNAVTGNAGTTNSAGLTIGSRGTSGVGSVNSGNVEIAYIIVRSGVDDLATQNLFIAFLQKRFGL